MNILTNNDLHGYPQAKITQCKRLHREFSDNSAIPCRSKAQPTF
jgi:hypothetical protein